MRVKILDAGPPPSVGSATIDAQVAGTASVKVCRVDGLDHAGDDLVASWATEDGSRCSNVGAHRTDRIHHRIVVGTSTRHRCHVGPEQRFERAGQDVSIGRRGALGPGQTDVAVANPAWSIPDNGLPCPVGWVDSSHAAGSLAIFPRGPRSRAGQLDLGIVPGAPSREWTVDISCVTKRTKLDMRWPASASTRYSSTSISNPSAAFAIGWSDGGYTTNLPLEGILNGQAFVAFNLAVSR